VGSNHACAVVQHGRVVCWGNNGSHQLGDGTDIPNSLEPVKVQGLPE
jgi:alpha-tubulin suppressor-like RCC1 family protein